MAFHSDEWLRASTCLFCWLLQFLLCWRVSWEKPWPSLDLGACLGEVQTGKDRIYACDSINPRVSTLKVSPPISKPERCPLVTEPMEPWESLTQPSFHACHLETMTTVGLHTRHDCPSDEVCQSWACTRKPRGHQHLGFHTVAGVWRSSGSPTGSEQSTPACQGHYPSADAAELYGVSSFSSSTFHSSQLM